LADFSSFRSLYHLPAIRIEITAAAYAALCAGVPENRRLPAQGSPTGGFYLGWTL
jgi:hypothetical protein